MSIRPHISRSAVLVLALGSVVLCSGRALATGRSGGYGWPVKPFDKPHPVRGDFGDPRTIFAGPPTDATVLTGGGKFSFHFGVDISAPDGTAVYPVVSGMVVEVSTVKAAERVGVSAGDGRSFDYWHIRAAVHVGQHVEACKTVLGTILRESKHVHFSEYLNGRPVNPLQPGHLTPYEDTARPVVSAISVRQPGTGGDSLATFVRGSVDFVAEVHDTPSLPVPGQWAGMPVGPALVTWRLQVPGGRAVVPERVAVDFRTSIPPEGRFWSLYARGTYQNMSVFGQHYSWLQPGRLLYRLTRACFDTRSVRDGVYDLVVTATDSRGNTGAGSLRLTIHNRAGWEGS